MPRTRARNAALALDLGKAAAVAGAFVLAVGVGVDTSGPSPEVTTDRNSATVPGSVAPDLDRKMDRYRCSLTGVSEAVSERFATALDEVVSPMAAPRYVVPRWVVDVPAAGPSGLVTGLAAATGLLRPAGEVWHPVPTALGTRADRAQGFAAAWDRWVGGGQAVYTGSPRGEGVLVTHRGSDPFALTTVLRVHWR